MKQKEEVIYLSLAIVKPIDDKGDIDARKLHEKYSGFCQDGVSVMVFVNRIFNEEKRVVVTPKTSLDVPIKVLKGGYPEYKINLFRLMEKYGIARLYYVELIATNFIIKRDDKVVMIPIFPNEIILDCDYGIEVIIKKEIETLHKIGKSYEIIGILQHKDLPQIAEDMREAIIRFERQDYDGAIKFFRKVTEGFKKIADKSSIESENRTDALKKFLTGAYHLMSNFGEHAGSSGSMEEAILSKDISIAISEYMVKKLEV